MQKNKVTPIKSKLVVERGDNINSPIYLFTISVKNDINHVLLDDYITSLEIWLVDNCKGKYFINVYATPIYEIPNAVEIGIEYEEDAVLFKLGPMWHKHIDNSLVI